MTGRIGIRVNPVVGGGKVAILSTAGKTSKFGLLMVDECEAKLLELYGKYKFLQGKSYFLRLDIILKVSHNAIEIGIR